MEHLKMLMSEQYSLLWKHEKLATVPIVLSLCAAEFIWKCSWLYICIKVHQWKYVFKRKRQISDFSCGLRHQFLGSAPVIILTVSFFKVNRILLLDESPPKLIHISLEWNQHKINWFESISIADIIHQSNHITSCTYYLSLWFWGIEVHNIWHLMRWFSFYVCWGPFQGTTGVKKP